MSITVGTVVAGASGSFLGSVVSGALHVLKIVACISFALIFMSAIVALFGLIEQFISTTIIGEFFLIVSMCLPFNAVVVFGSIYLVLTGILAFVVARKIFQMTLILISSTGH